MTQVANTTPPTTNGAGTATTEPPRHNRWRRYTGTVLLIISCVLAPISVMSIWVRNQVLDTNRYVDNVAPLASNQEIINTAAADITTTLFNRVDVASEVKNALPARADFLASPIAAALRDTTERAAQSLLSSKQFQSLWREANRVAHEQLRKALTGGGPIISTKNGRIELDLSAAVERVRLTLKERGIGIFDRIPVDQLALKFEIADAHQLEKAQRATKALNTASWLLPVTSLVALGGALWCSGNRRRTLSRWGLGIAIAVTTLGVVLALARLFYLNSVTSPALPRATAAAVFDTLVRFLREGIRLVLAVGLIVAIASWLLGPGGAATRVRATARSLSGRSGEALGEHGWTFGPVGTWASAHVRALRIAGAAIVALVFILFDRPTARVALGLAIALAIYLLVVEVVARAGHTLQASHS